MNTPMNHALPRVAACLVTGLCASLLLTACNAPPKGENTRRVETTDTTKAERRSPLIQPVSLIEFSDQAAQQLVADLVERPEFNEGYKVNIIFGDIVNKTGIVPTSDFEAFRNRLRSKLLSSSVARSKVRWIENRARMEELRRREAAENPGKAQEHNWQYTYFLNADMYNVSRVEGQTVNMYMLNFTLSNADNLELVWQNSYETKQTPGR